MSASRIFKKSIEKVNKLSRGESFNPRNNRLNDRSNDGSKSSKGVEGNRSYLKRMKEIAEGEDDTNRISRAAMESLGVPYKDLRLYEKVEEFYILVVEDDEGRTIRKRVHLNSIPERLLRALYRTTPFEEAHEFLLFMERWGFIDGDKDFPIYHGGDRAAMCQTDADGNLREMPAALEAALKLDKEYFRRVLSQKAIKAFYAPPRLRKILYHTAPVEERCDYLLNEEERNTARYIDYPVTESMLRFRLMERFDENGQLRELSDELELAIIDEEVVNEYDLADFDRGLGYE